VTYGELKRRLRRLGVEFIRHGARHDIWENLLMERSNYSVLRTDEYLKGG
jgi:hypothetical protein